MLITLYRNKPIPRFSLIFLFVRQNKKEDFNIIEVYVAFGSLTD